MQLQPRSGSAADRPGAKYAATSRRDRAAASASAARDRISHLRLMLLA
ncbi:MAG TPA: hypothetical protein VFJ19_16995 [Nocardioidaceae bacterium]|nr:hypothetical protein [Nocardioidaceae bacterium]